MYMCKQDLALNNLQWLICHKTEPIKPNNIFFYYSKCKSSSVTLTLE